MCVVRICLLLALVALPAQAMAGVYKCKDADQNTVYSQFPCPDTSSEEVSVGVPKKIDPKICGLAYDFSHEVAGRMRQDSSAKQEKGLLSGEIAGANTAAVIIDYIYGFKDDPDVSNERIAELTMAKCSNGGFGNISADSIPRRDADEETGEEAVSDEPPVPPLTAESESSQSPTDETPQIQATEADASELAPNSAVNEVYLRQCGNYRKSLRSIDNSMRQGYSSAEGERLRQQRKHYQELIRKNCS